MHTFEIEIGIKYLTLEIEENRCEPDQGKLCRRNFMTVMGLCLSYEAIPEQ
jgi:hypothetical protein